MHINFCKKNSSKRNTMKICVFILALIPLATAQTNDFSPGSNFSADPQSLEEQGIQQPTVQQPTVLQPRSPLPSTARQPRPPRPRDAPTLVTPIGIEQNQRQQQGLLAPAPRTEADTFTPGTSFSASPETQSANPLDPVVRGARP